MDIRLMLWGVKTRRKPVGTGRGAAVSSPRFVAALAAALAIAPALAVPPPGDPQLPPRISADLVYSLAADAPDGTDAASRSLLRRARLVGGSVQTAEVVSLETLAILTPTLPGGVIRGADGSLLIAGSGNAAVAFDPESGVLTPRVVCHPDDFDPASPPVIRDLCPDFSPERAWVIADRPMVSGLTLAPQYRPGRATPLDGDDLDITSLAFTSIEVNHQPFQRVFYAAEGQPFSPGGEPLRSLGFLSTFTGGTVRLMANLPAARALAHDAFTGDVIVAGGRFIAQVDAQAVTPHLVCVIDLATAAMGGESLDLVDVTTDGHGRVYAMSADGRLVVIDVADVSDGAQGIRIDDPDAVLRVMAVEPRTAPPPPGGEPEPVMTVRGLLPLSGPGSMGAGVSSADCLWDNGEADGLNGQLSQVNPDQGQPETADDLYLCPGRVYRLDTLSATLSSDTVFPKAHLAIYADCDGKPGERIASFETFDLTPTGEVIDGRYTVYTARFMLGGLYADGGRDGRSLWVSVRGVGLGTGLEEWFWQTAGDRVIKGRPGVFRSAAHGHPDWTPIDGFGCGCSDFAFRVHGHSCKVLLDGGPPDVFAEPAGVLSQIASDADSARAADDLVVPPCGEVQSVCYLRGYLFSNCTPVRGRFELYEDACGRPGSSPGEPVRQAAFQRVTDLGYSVLLGDDTMTLYCVEAFGLDWTLLPGRNYWISPVGDTTFGLRRRAYAAFGRHCDAPRGSDGGLCLSRFSPARVNGRGVGLTRWTGIVDSTGQERDLALVVAIENAETPALYDPAAACPGDVNRDGVLGLEDLFDYLTAWFVGCP